MFRLSLPAALALLLVLLLSLGLAYARTQLAALCSQVAHASPEEAMQTLLADSYRELRSVHIVRSEPELTITSRLRFVEARVWAESRADGKGVPVEGDNPGSFFLRLAHGWVHVPEGHFPALLALALALCGDPCA